MPYRSSSIRHKMFYSAVSAEMLRICTATTKFQDITKSAKILIGSIKKEGLINQHENGSMETI